MAGRSRPFAHAGILVAGAIILVAGHGIVLRYVSAHIALPAAVIAGVIVLALVAHLGLIGALTARFRRLSPPRR